MAFDVKFYKGNYKTRQNNANKDGCVLYVEHHFNSSAKKPNANYSVVIVGKNASNKSKSLGRDYTSRASKVFGTTIAGNDGVMVGGYSGRGNYNLRFTSMPAILLEPLFASNERHADIIRDRHEVLAKILVATIRNEYSSGLIGFSVGHKYKPIPYSRDRGARVVGGGTEADNAEQVLLLAEKMLVDNVDIEAKEDVNIKIIFNDKLDREYIGTTISWNEEQKKLYIYK